MDLADELQGQGVDGARLTWIDAKVDGWVVTPPGVARQWRQIRFGTMH